MAFLKFSPFLAVSMLVLYQAGLLQGSPVSSALESHLYPASLSEEEGDLLVDTLMKDNKKRMADEQGQETEEPSVTAQKRECNLATYATGNLADTLRRHGGILSEGFEATNVGPNSYGRRRRDLQS